MTRRWAFLRVVWGLTEIRPQGDVPMDTVKGAAKAVVAFLYGAGSWVAATLPDLGSFGELTQGQWLQAVLAGLVGAGLVYSIPNKEPV